METLHILVMEAGALDEVNRAALPDGTVDWVVPKAARPGDKAVFFFQPLGFIGRGEVLRRPYPGMHGKRPVYRAAVGKIVLFRHPVELHEVAKKFPRWAWVRYPRSYASVQGRLSSALYRFLNSASNRDAGEIAALEGIAREARVMRSSRNRSLRDEALRRAGGICAACGVDYSKLLGGRGKRILQVHHRKQLAASRVPRKTALSDLAVVCANCHAIIHANPKKAISVERLRQLWRKSKGKMNT